jgi:hypothetical protein
MPIWMRRHGVSMAMAVVAAVLGVYLYVVDSGRVTTRELEGRKRNLFRVWRRADIALVDVEANGGVAHIVKREDDAGDSLFLLDNGEVADQVTVDKLLGVLEFATPERRVDAKTDRQAMGLAAPRARVSISMGRAASDRIVYTLSIGGPAPSPPASAYAELAVHGGGLEEQNGVFVVPRDFVAELLRPVDVYRGRTLVPYLSSSLSALALEGAGGERRFANGPEGWRILREGGKVRTDRAVFDRMLTALAEVRAETFIADAEAERAQRGTDQVRIVMTPRDKSLPRAVIDVGGDCPGHADDVVAIHREPPPQKAACVPKGVLDGLAQPLDRFVDRHLFSLRADEMEEIALRAGKERLEIVRAGTGFRQRAPAEGNVDPEVGQAFARSLAELTAESVISRDVEPTKESSRTATITKVDGGEEQSGAETVEIGETGEGGFVEVRRVADGARLRVAPDVANALAPSGLALRSRTVLDETASHVRRIAIESSIVRQAFTRSSSGGYTLDEPKNFAIDAGLASDVTEAIVKLRAERWVTERDDGSFGFADSGAHYEIGLEASAIRIDIGRATSGGVFAKVADRPEVFVLSDVARRNIETWAIDRSYFMIDPAEVRQIRMRRGATTWDLSATNRDGGVSIERFEIARKVLAEARAEGVVHLGPARKEEGLDKPRLDLVVRAAPPAPADPHEIRIAVGSGDVFRDNHVFYVRRAGVDATFAIAQSKLRPLLEMP